MVYLKRILASYSNAMFINSVDHRLIPLNCTYMPYKWLVFIKCMLEGNSLHKSAFLTYTFVTLP
ncbi:hypothetical protein FA727_17035 [Robertmurraya kyonggiensis]|uniref:Uncharacterized protein n=1 Tax=Robertmurraya kyonggiensis TaxID=1037680 RepID=A0A4U1D0X9_9BACI|nr:hypothetical protein FA727_17035 [Robertmurraya kyonggiensis]